MENVFKHLPLNRKEKFWTSCVLPAIICGDKFRQLKHFFRLTNIREIFIKDTYSKDEIAFFTEYCLRDSALEWDETKQLSAETPDLVILLLCGENKYLIFIEAKMFDCVTNKEIRDQLDKQKKIAKVILNKNNMDESNFLHVALFLEVPEGFAVSNNEIVITWNQILDSYNFLENDYFLELLKKACSSKNLMSKGVHSYGANKTGNLKYKQILHRHNMQGNFYVGRDGNLEKIREDCENEVVKKFSYEVNTDLNPDYDCAPGKTGRNWFAASEFIKILNEYGIYK